MPVLERSFFNLVVIEAPLRDLVTAFSALPSLKAQVQPTPLAFPSQPYGAGPQDLPMVLWSPSCAPQLSAFMPHVSSGDYFVVEYAYERFGYSAFACRSTVQDVEWPINEFIVYQDRQRRRVVRAMRDAPRWEFYCYGEPLDFEDERAYSARLIRDRFQRETLISYLECWGAPVRDPAFWASGQGAMTFTPAGMTANPSLQPTASGGG